ncbi:MAG: hypothetical protein V4615_00030 [Bacteroidota bacterium]
MNCQVSATDMKMLTTDIQVSATDMKTLTTDIQPKLPSAFLRTTNPKTENDCKTLRHGCKWIKHSCKRRKHPTEAPKQGF